MNKSREFTALIIITVILTAFSGLVRAQDEDEEEHGYYITQPKLFYGGLVAGANFAQVDGDYFAGYHKMGLNAGGIVYAHLTRHVAVSLEILYSEKGSRSTYAQVSPYDPNVIIRKYGINVNYAEVPVMIHYFDKRKSHFGLGVSYGRLVNSTENVQAVDTNHQPIYPNFNQQYPFKKDAFDFVAGADLHLWKGFFLDIRFQYSLIPIRTQLPPADYARATQYSNLWVVRLMYLLY